jgi:hypothetical protein
MALMMDAILTPDETPIIPKYVHESPRNLDGYNAVTRRLEYRVRWSNQSPDTLEPYPALRYLDFVYEYEKNGHH